MNGPYVANPAHEATGAGATSAQFQPPTDAPNSYWVRVTDPAPGATVDSKLAKVTLCNPPVARPSVSTTRVDGVSWRLVVNDISASSFEWFVGAPGDTNKPAPYLHKIGVSGSSTVFAFDAGAPVATNDYWVRVNHGCPVDSANSERVDVCPLPQIIQAPDIIAPFINIPAGGTLKVTATGGDLAYQPRAEVSGRAQGARRGRRVQLLVALLRKMWPMAVG